jgi:hypothetical protein
MNKIPCLYAIVRFAPFVETGEFANVGIVIMAPAAGYFGFKLMDKRYGRITRFFEQMRPAVFRGLMANLREEFAGKHQLLKQHGFDQRRTVNDVEFAKRVFMEITRAREAIIRFSEVRGVLADAPDTKLQELYAHYVERDFATKEYQEATLERGVRRLLLDAGVMARFDPMKVGNDEYHANFPFVEKTNDGIILTAIKPLHLAHDQPSKILDHGGQWLFRTQTLKKRRLLPARVLFAVNGPKEDGARGRAFAEIVAGLQDSGVEVLPCSDKERIVQFTRGI